MGCCHSYFKLDEDQTSQINTTRLEDITPRVDDLHHASSPSSSATKKVELENPVDRESTRVAAFAGYIPKSRIEVKYDTTIKRNLEVNLTHDELKDDLKPLNFGPLVQEKCDQYMPGTRTWIFKDAKTWLADTKGNRVFWLAGDGGTVSLSISA